MKKILLSLALLAGALFADAATTMNYARTVQTADGKAAANTEVKVRVNIHKSTADGDIVFTEDHNVTTSPTGIAYVTIGSVSTLSLEGFDWGHTPYFIETSVDSGSGFANAVCQQVLSVPVAVHAKTASKVILTSPSGKKFSVTISENGEISTVEVK